VSHTSRAQVSKLSTIIPALVLTGSSVRSLTRDRDLLISASTHFTSGCAVSANATLSFLWEQVSSLPSQDAAFTGIVLSADVVGVAVIQTRSMQLDDVIAFHDDGQITIPATSITSRTLYFPRFFFAHANRQYAFRCTVTSVDAAANTTSSNSAVVALLITSRPLVAAIRGGDRVLSMDQPLVLNGTASRDPDAPEDGKSKSLIN